MKVDLIDIRAVNELTDSVKSLYLTAFPPEERRPWDNIESMLVDGSQPYKIYVINCNSVFAGFISFWQFDEFIYVEHFAIEPTYRGHGVGAEVIKLFVALDSRPIVLEVEPMSSSEMAMRRINFYLRCGFDALYDYSYEQPPYAPELPSVPLMLMTYGNKNLNLDKTTSQIHRYVYKKE